METIATMLPGAKSGTPVNPCPTVQPAASDAGTAIGRITAECNSGSRVVYLTKDHGMNNDSHSLVVRDPPGSSRPSRLQTIPGGKNGLDALEQLLFEDDRDGPLGFIDDQAFIGLADGFDLLGRPLAAVGGTGNLGNDARKARRRQSARTSDRLQKPEPYM